MLLEHVTLQTVMLCLGQAIRKWFDMYVLLPVQKTLNLAFSESKSEGLSFDDVISGNGNRIFFSLLDLV
jgi:hypothetical protein